MRGRWFKGMLICLLAGYAVCCWLYDPSEHAFFPKCLFHELTGFNCPGCGSQRAVYALLHGDIRRAMHSNLLLVVLLPVLAGYFATEPVPALKRKRAAWWKISRRSMTGIGVAVVIVFWILRNIPAGPFTLLSPAL